MMWRSLRAFACAAGLLMFGSLALAQTAPLAEEIRPVQLDSGLVAAPAGGAGAQVVYSGIVAADGAPWIRLNFDEVRLPGSERDGAAAYLRITSFDDAAVQTMNARHVGEWQATSAYFNGDAVLLEILAFAGTGESRVRISEVMAGLPPIGVDSICGPTDDRELSTDPRTARLLPIGCSAWIINDCNHCFLTAGHCASTSGAPVVQFNVPLSSSSGSLIHPGPEDQYAMDTSSMIDNGGQGVGDDWGYFGANPNSTTGLTPFEKQRDAFDLAPAAPPVGSQQIRITGYGTTGSGVPRQWNQAQKTHAGPYFDLRGTRVMYTTDTTGGNSGSPVIDDSTGLAIGIHTHGGCASEGGNTGTAINHPGLLAALAAPQGVCCLTPPLLDFAFPGGRPDFVTPGVGTVVDVEVIESGGVADPGSGMLHVSIDGGPFEAFPMAEVSPLMYEATLPAVDCGQTLDYYVSATADGGEMRTSPADAPDEAYSATVATGVATIADLDFETAPGWTFEHVGVLDGHWDRGDPVSWGRGDPEADFDGSGQCFLTDNSSLTSNSDVDGGPTRLISPVYDLSGLGGATVSYARWFYNDLPDVDRMTVEVSSNGGSSWEVLEIVAHTAGWVVKEFDVGSVVPLTSEFRIRFSAIDNPNNSVTEAGIDAFKLLSIECNTCLADLTGDGILDFFDFLEFQNLFAAGDPRADFLEDGTLDFFDFLAFQNAFAAGCS